MTRPRFYIFTLRDNIAMADAANDIEDLADRVAEELPDLVDRIHRIGDPTDRELVQA